MSRLTPAQLIVLQHMVMGDGYVELDVTPHVFRSRLDTSVRFLVDPATVQCLVRDEYCKREGDLLALTEKGEAAGTKELRG